MATATTRANVRVNNIHIQNVVTSATLNHHLDLDEIAASLPNIEANPEKYAGIIYRLENPESVLFLYAKGTIVTISAKSREVSVEAIHKTIQVMRDLGIAVDSNPLIAVRNILATVSAEGRINVELAAMMLENTVYEPEHFPGLVYKPTQELTITLFSQGKMVITGAKTRSEIEELVEVIIDRCSKLGILEKYENV